MNEQTPLHKMTKDQLKLVALKQRIGEITSMYEDRMADMRADTTQQIGAYQDVLREQEEQVENLQAQLKKYQDAENNVQVEEEDGNKKPSK